MIFHSKFSVDMPADSHCERDLEYFVLELAIKSLIESASENL